MKKFLLIFTILCALVMGGWTWDDRGSAHAQTAPMQISPGDGGMPCDEAHVWQFYFQPWEGQLWQCVPWPWYHWVPA